MARRKWWIAASVVVTVALVAFVATALYIALPTKAASGKNAYAQPRWWAKYQVVSAKNFTPLPNPGPHSSVKVGANINVSNEPGPQSETNIAINPANPKQIVAGSNEIFRLPMRGYFSSDGGATWGGVDLPLPPAIGTNGYDFGSDPGVAWDLHGNVYYSYIVVFFGAGGGVNGSEMAVARSADSGQTWTPTYFNFQTGSAQFNDKPMITVDNNPSSPHEGTVYVGWDYATGGNGSSSSSNFILVSHSTDHGVTFSAPVPASDTSAGPKGGIGADPFVAPDGTVHVAWLDYRNGGINESSSNDGGLTFGPTHLISATNLTFDIAIPAENVRGALVYPSCAADRSSRANRGTLYCVWMDLTASNGTDIFLARSMDGGASWSAALRVNDDATGVANDQFNQWLAVDPTNGSVSMSWQDTRNDPAHQSTDVYYARSTDGGLSVSANVKVTTAMSNETCCGANLGDQYGDYGGIDAYGGVAYPFWTDRRVGGSVDGYEETYTAAVTAK
jgi:hypothetical protein